MNHRGLLIVAVFFCVIIEPAGAAELITLRYGQNAASTGNLSSLPLTVVERKRFFIREGLNLVVVPIAGGTDRIVAVLKGSDAVAIIAQTANPVYSLIVRPEIKGFADLKGKVMGLSTPGDTITLPALRLLAHNKIKPADFQLKRLSARARASTA